MQNRKGQSLGLVTLAVVALLTAGARASIVPLGGSIQASPIGLPSGGNGIVGHTGQERPPPNWHTGQERDVGPGDIDIPEADFGSPYSPIDTGIGLPPPSESSPLPPPDQALLLQDLLDNNVPIFAPLADLKGPSFGGLVPGEFGAPSAAPIPAPGALVLLGLAGLLNRRRRRR